MAPSISSPLNAFTALHSFPHIFKLNLFSPFYLPLSPIAHNVADRIPHRHSAPLLSSLSSAELNERNPESRLTREQRNGSKRGGGCMQISDSRNQRGERTQKKSKKGKANPAEVDFRVKLDMCSKAGDVLGAISLYDSALKDGIYMGQYHYNVLLYLCSSAAMGVIHPAKSGSSSNTGGSHDSDEDDPSDEKLESNSSDERNDRSPSIHVSDDVRVYARTRGFEIYEHMCSQKIPMSEAALTSIARMALSMGDGNMAFETLKQMKAVGITPRLRSYGPAIFAFCDSGDVDKAFEVERHMLGSGVYPEEPELEALLRASVRARRGDKVYYLLHKLRTNVRQVSPSTADLIEDWFESPTASRLGKRKWDANMLKQAMENVGGGWHGLGWLGKGKWVVVRTHVDDSGICIGCGEKLVTVDLDPAETENFARSVASIASKRERNSSFQKFQVHCLDFC